MFGSGTRGNLIEFRSILALVEADRWFIHMAVEPQVLIVLTATFIALPTKLAVYMLEARSLCSIGDPAFSQLSGHFALQPLLPQVVMCSLRQCLCESVTGPPS